LIIAVTGLKRSGKNTVSSYISEKYGFKEYAFAQPIKDVCGYLFNWTPERIENEKEVIDPTWGISPRQILQWMGTEAFQYSLPAFSKGFLETVGRNFWVKKFEQVYLKEKGNFIISDFRFYHEQEALRKYNAVTIKVIRNSVQGNDLHESERYIRDMECMYSIMNNGTKEDLYKEVDKIMEELEVPILSENLGDCP